MKIILSGLILLLAAPFCNAQSLNQYEYVVIPAEYDFLKYENQYELNDLTKFLFEKEGFKAVYNKDVRRAEFSKDQCAGLFVGLDNTSNMLTTKLIITLRDCDNKVVWESLEGKSKIKNYKKGYHEALRKAFEPIKDLDYQYTEQKTEEDALKAAAAAVRDAVNVTKEAVSEAKEVKETAEEEDIIAVEEEIIEVEEVKKVETEVVIKEASTKKEMTTAAVEPGLGILLYAQATADGFQLVNSTPEVVYVMVKLTKEDLYLLKNKNGIIYKDLGRWFAEYYQDNKLIREAIQIKF